MALEIETLNANKVQGVAIIDGATGGAAGLVKKALDYVGGTNPIYIGVAAPGSLTSAAAWTIQKLTYDANNNVTAVTWATVTNGKPSGTEIWDSRAALTYS